MFFVLTTVGLVMPEHEVAEILRAAGGRLHASTNVLLYDSRPAGVGYFVIVGGALSDVTVRHTPDATLFIVDDVDDAFALALAEVLDWRTTLIFERFEKWGNITNARGATSRLVSAWNAAARVLRRLPR